MQRGDYSKLRLEQRGDEFGELATTFDSMRDAISQREQRISFQATHDQLTALPNRRYFAKQLQAKLQVGECGSLLLLNIHQFRRLNDTLGQQVGDQVLRQIANRLGSVNGVSLLARVGGDEFALVLKQPIESAQDAFVKDLLEQLQAPVKVGESDYPVSFHCGGVRFPQRETSLILCCGGFKLAHSRPNTNKPFCIATAVDWMNSIYVNCIF